MHELSIAQALVDEARLAANASAPGRRVVAIELEVGELSGVVPRVLRSVFSLAAEGTVLEGARLRIRRIRARLECARCGISFGPSTGGLCPRCAMPGSGPAGGRELQLTGLEVEETQPTRRQ